MTGLKVILGTQEKDRKGNERSKIRFKNVSLFVVEIFHLIIQMDVFFYSLFFLVYI